jgi:hypothetical protein
MHEVSIPSKFSKRNSANGYIHTQVKNSLYDWMRVTISTKLKPVEVKQDKQVPACPSYFLPSSWQEPDTYSSSLDRFAASPFHGSGLPQSPPPMRLHASPLLSACLPLPVGFSILYLVPQYARRAAPVVRCDQHLADPCWTRKLVQNAAAPLHRTRACGR